MTEASKTLFRDETGATIVQGQDVVLAIGIPMGRYVYPESVQPPHGLRVEYGVRNGRRFVVLDEDGYTIWDAARNAFGKGELVGLLAEKLRRGAEDISRDLNAMVVDGLLVHLSGRWEEDWEKIERLRPIPRAVAYGTSPKSLDEFVVATPDAKRELVVDVVGYDLWTFWDGALSIGEAAERVSAHDGLPAEVTRERSHSLLVGCARMGLVFVDGPERIGEGGEGRVSRTL